MVMCLDAFGRRALKGAYVLLLLWGCFRYSCGVAKWSILINLGERRAVHSSRTDRDFTQVLMDWTNDRLSGPSKGTSEKLFERLSFMKTLVLACHSWEKYLFSGFLLRHNFWAREFPPSIASNSFQAWICPDFEHRNRNHQYVMDTPNNTDETPRRHRDSPRPRA